MPAYQNPDDQVFELTMTGITTWILAHPILFRRLGCAKVAKGF
jgi:hypothetical protein